MNETDKLKQRICDIINTRMPKYKLRKISLTELFILKTLLLLFFAAGLLDTTIAILDIFPTSLSFYQLSPEPVFVTLPSDAGYLPPCFDKPVYLLSSDAIRISLIFLLGTIPYAVLFFAVNELPRPTIRLFLIIFIASFSVGAAIPFVIFGAAALIICDIASIFQKRVTPVGTAVQKYCWITKCGNKPDRKLLPEFIHSSKALVCRCIILHLTAAAAVFRFLWYDKGFPFQINAAYFKNAAFITVILVASAIITAVLRVKITTHSFAASDFYIGKLKTLIFIVMIFSAPLFNYKYNKIYSKQHKICLYDNKEEYRQLPNPIKPVQSLEC